MDAFKAPFGGDSVVMTFELLAHVTEVESVSLVMAFAMGAFFGSVATFAAGFAVWRRKR